MLSPRDVIARVPELAGATIGPQLTAGPVSHKWVVQSGGSRWVVRIDAPLAASLALDRNAEQQALQALAEAGWQPPPLWADVAQGVLVTHYVPGVAWQAANYHEPASLRLLAVLLAKLHALPATVPEFALMSRVRSYAHAIASSEASRRAQVLEQDIAALIAANPRTCFCHNDAVGGNVVAQNGLALIDWEYAGVGSPLFELAVVIEYQALNEAETRVFLDAYRAAGHPADGIELQAWRGVYRETAALWAEAVDAAAGV